VVQGLVPKVQSLSDAALHKSRFVSPRQRTSDKPSSLLLDVGQRASPAMNRRAIFSRPLMRTEARTSLSAKPLTARFVEPQRERSAQFEPWILEAQYQPPDFAP
jgi:hypothetical protein